MVNRLDLRGDTCPFTFVRTKLMLEEMAGGAELEIVIDSATSAKQVPRSLTAEGHEVKSVSEENGTWTVIVQKRKS